MATIDLEKFVCYIIGRCEKNPNKPIHSSRIHEALRDQGLEYKDGQIVEINKPFRIEAGQQYMCIKDYLADDGDVLFTQGRVYVSCYERGLVDNYNMELYVPDCKGYFRPATEEEAPQKLKFKVGDWIIGRATSNEPRQISEITDRCYKSTYGGQYGFSFEDKMHLWTIRDAKKGDILEFVDHGRLVVGIVSFVNERTGKVDVSCLLEDNKFKIGNFYALDTINPHPATKEQRDLLFQEMREAGYEWDAEKKELKKIQKPEKESSAFEERLSEIIWCTIQNKDIIDVDVYVKKWAKELFTLARK